MQTTKLEPIDYLTLLSYVKELGIKIYTSNQIDSKFTDSELLGHGNSMNVYRGNLIEDPTDLNCEYISVAIKVPKVNIKDMNRDTKAFKVLADVRQELRMMKHFESHPNIISLYGVIFQDLKPATIVELAEDSINEYLAIKKEEQMPVDWETKARFCCETADGLQALHAAKIVHGDLKGDNILLFKDHKGKLVAKISDFGYSATTASIERGGRTGGSLNFLAPECTRLASPEIKEYENHPLKDNYAFGLFVWQVAKDGEVPYDEMDEDDIHRLKNSDINLDKLMNNLDEGTPQYFRDVIKAMTRYSPEEREVLTKVREIMGLEDMNDASYTAAKNNLELYAKELPRNITKADLSSIEFMSIPLSLRTKIYRNYEKAAANNDAKAMFMLAICHSTGFAVELDKDIAFKWCIKAAKAGSLDAILNIAENYEIRDLPVKPKDAFPWYLKAAENGHKEAAWTVYSCYHYGNGVEEDAEMANHWYNVYENCRDTSMSEMNINLGETSLHRAARLGNVEAARFLLEQKSIHVDTVSIDGETALHIAAKYGHVEIAKLLMTYGAKTDAISHSRKTPLELAAGKGYVEIVRLFTDVTTITVLNLPKSNLGPSEACSLSKSLRMYSALTELHLSENNIGDEGASALAECLKTNLTLTELDLFRNKISDKGICALAECLEQNSTLTSLILRTNNIGSKGACTLAECLKQNSTLSQLDLKDNKIGAEGASALAEYLKRSPSLVRLDLGANKLGSEGAYALAECLKQNATLTQLSLKVNNIGIKGALALAECLKENSTLIQLDLEYNKIGDEGACALAECLGQNSTLSKLDLIDNRIGINGARALGKCLEQNSTLLRLDLIDNDFGDEGVEVLTECLKQSSALILRKDLESVFDDDEAILRVII